MLLAFEDERDIEPDKNCHPESAAADEGPAVFVHAQEKAGSSSAVADSE
jgi:hypothetical protein